MLSVLLYTFGGLATVYGLFRTGTVVYFVFVQEGAQLEWLVILLQPISRDLSEAFTVLIIGLILLSLRRIIRILDE